MRIFIICFILLSSLPGLAQLGFRDGITGRIISATDINGVSLFGKEYDDVDGTPFLNEEWAEANLQLANGKEIKNVKVKLNIENNDLYYQDTSQRILVLAEGLVRQINFINLSSKDYGLYTFKNAYPSAGGKSETFFYQVLSSGKIDLLRKYYKSIDVLKKDMSGEIEKKFVDREQFYIFSPSGMKEIQKDKSFFLEVMKDKQPEIQSFLSSNKISFKKISDIQKLVSYYNTLK